jgi:hypothetical protein
MENLQTEDIDFWCRSSDIRAIRSVDWARMRFSFAGAARKPLSPEVRQLAVIWRICVTAGCCDLRLTVECLIRGRANVACIIRVGLISRNKLIYFYSTWRIGYAPTCRQDWPRSRRVLNSPWNKSEI